MKSRIVEPTRRPAIPILMQHISTGNVVFFYDERNPDEGICVLGKQYGTWGKYTWNGLLDCSYWGLFTGEILLENKESYAFPRLMINKIGVVSLFYNKTNGIVIAPKKTDKFIFGQMGERCQMDRYESRNEYLPFYGQVILSN